MSKVTQWEGSESNCWTPVGATVPHIKPDIYHVHMSMSGPYLSSFDPISDQCVIVADGISEHIINSIKKFRDRQDTFKRFNVLHKRGILLEGPPGSGKSMSTMLAAKNVATNGGIVVAPRVPENFRFMASMLRRIREIEPNLLILCILEDIHDEDYCADEYTLLSLLDGQDQVGNIFFIATTNYISQLPAVLTNRPKRFDEVIHVGAPSDKARHSYLSQVMPLDEPNRDAKIAELVKHSDGMMLAHLAELMVSHLVLEYPLEEAAKRLKTMNADGEQTDQALVNTPDAIVTGALTPKNAAPWMKRLKEGLKRR